MININNILKDAPESVKSRYRHLYEVADHPIYHPEGTTGRHVTIVLHRVLDTNDIDFVFIALLHDICKGDSGKVKQIPKDKFPIRLPQGGSYWQNLYHPQESCEFISNDKDVVEWIKNYKGNFERIHTVIKEHMKIKSYVKGVLGEKGGMKKSKQIKYETENDKYLKDILQFRKFDSMLNEDFKELDNNVDEFEEKISKILDI